MSPADGRYWFEIGCISAVDVDGFEPGLIWALERSLAISPADEAATRELLRLELRVNGVASAINRLHYDELVSHSYESIGLLASALMEHGSTAEAIRFFQRCIVIAPSRPEAFDQLGQLLSGSGDFSAASKLYGFLCRLSPTDDDARSRYLLCDFRSGSLSAFRELISLGAASAKLPVLLNVGLAYLDEQVFDEAITTFSKAIALYPGSPDAWSKLVIPMFLINRTDAARQLATRALDIDATWLEAIVNLGRVLEAHCDYGSAIFQYEKALRLRPSLTEPRFNASTCYLGLGDFERGWKYYSARWGCNSVVRYGRDSKSVPLVSRKPHLDEAHPAGRVLVWTEQGIGDEIMFCSLLPELQDQVSQLIIQCDDRLVPLFRRSFLGADVLGRSKSIPEARYDSHIPMGDLGGRFRRNADKFNGRGKAFLYPDLTRVMVYKNLFSSCDKPLIGISWRSGSYQNGALRSVCVDKLVSVLGSFGVRLLCLQYGRDTFHEVRACQDRTGIEISLINELDLTVDIDGVAAAVRACDLVVSVGNTVAHLAAACGTPTWLLAAKGTSWRWMFSGERTPWYEAVRIFRQLEIGQWDETLINLEREFDRYLKTSNF